MTNVTIRRGVTGIAWLAAAALFVTRVRYAAHVPAAGMDYAPLRHAGSGLLDGRSVYSDRLFVYPPAAAPLFVALPPLTVWLALLAAAVAVSMLAVAAWPNPWRWALTGLLAALLVKSDLTTDTLWLGNISMLFAPVAAVIVWCFHARRWRLGSAVLVVSLLIKPLLVPMLVVPLLQRRWRDLAVTVLPGVAVLVVALSVVPGGWHFFSVLRYAAAGSDLRGAHAAYNVSIAGVFDAHGWPGALVVRAVVAVVAVGVAWRRRSEPVIVAVVLLIGLFLAGGLSESHYLFPALAVTVLAAAVYRHVATVLVTAVALLVAFVPRFYLGGVGGSALALQARWLTVELLAFVAVTTLRAGCPTAR